MGERKFSRLRKKTLVSWSSGKDSAWTLHVLRQSNEYEIVGLLTTINGNFDRVAMHGVRRELVEAQATAAGLPLWKVPLPWPCSNQEYEAAMSAACAKAIDAGVQAVAFGDLFLEDVRQYREDRMRGIGLAPVFPLNKLQCIDLPQGEHRRKANASHAIFAVLAHVFEEQIAKGNGLNAGIDRLCASGAHRGLVFLI